MRVHPLPIQVSSQFRMGGTPNWNSVACTCYTAGGMPFALGSRTFLLGNTFCRMCQSVHFLSFITRPFCYSLRIGWWVVDF